MPHKEIDQVIRDLKRVGYDVVKTSGQHYRITDPEGRFVTVTGSTPGGGRGLLNLRATIRRHERKHQMERSIA